MLQTGFKVYILSKEIVVNNVTVAKRACKQRMTMKDGIESSVEFFKVGTIKAGIATVVEPAGKINWQGLRTHKRKNIKRITMRTIIRMSLFISSTSIRTVVAISRVW